MRRHEMGPYYRDLVSGGDISLPAGDPTPDTARPRGFAARGGLVQLDIDAQAERMKRRVELSEP